MSAGPVVDAPSAALDRALSARGGAGAVAHFLNAVAPGEVRGALRTCLPPDGGDAALHLVRAKLKPGRTLTAEYDAVLLPDGPVRRISVTWVPEGAIAPGRADDAETEARRRGVLAPFRRSWAGSDDGRRSVSVAPVDGAFPQLVRLHDREHLLDVLRTTPAAGPLDDVPPADLTIETVRYRPGQRHVLRVRAGARGPVWFAKVYRDDTGRRAVAAAARAATALAAAGDGRVGLRSGTGGYVAADRVALWPEVPGRPLAEVITRSGSAAGPSVRAAGTALRLLHAMPPDGLPAAPDAADRAAETLRTAQVVDALAPALGARLRREVGRALELLAALPAEAPTATHGDFKCENLLVNGPVLHLLDFDRCGGGDPAADIGKFLADLRWWTDGDGPAAGRLQGAFLHGYGTADPARMARARLHDGLSLLRMAARRVPLHDPGWAARVARAVAVGTATLAGEAPS